MSKILRRWMQAGLFVALPLFTLPSYSADAALPAAVQQALNKSQINPRSFSLALFPLDGNGGRARLFNAQQSMNPASTMKLVTTYAALELLGPTYQWRTEIYSDGTLRNGVLSGNLYLKGGGDPKLNLERLWLLLRDLKASGVKRVTGDLVLSRNYFNPPNLPAFNDDGGNPLRPFLVEPDSLLVNFKAVRVVVRAADGKVNLNMDPPLATVPMVNQVKLLPARRPCPNPVVGFSLVEQKGKPALVVRGQMAAGCSTQFYLSLLDHPAYASAAVRALWKEMGGRIDGKDRLGDLPKNARLLSRALSPDLVEIIRDINKYSNNTMARQLFLSVGAQFRLASDKDDGEAAKRVIRDWMIKKGIKVRHLFMENGSGLSRNERVSAEELAALLRAAWKSPYAAEFVSSLPIAAMDGTMKNRLRGTALVGQAHLKTGTLKNARAIAGFSRDRSGRNWVVVAMVNDARPWNASMVLDQVLVDLYQQKSTATAQR